MRRHYLYTSLCYYCCCSTAATLSQLLYLMPEDVNENYDGEPPVKRVLNEYWSIYTDGEDDYSLILDSMVDDSES